MSSLLFILCLKMKDCSAPHAYAGKKACRRPGQEKMQNFSLLSSQF